MGGCPPARGCAAPAGGSPHPPGAYCVDTYLLKVIDFQKVLVIIGIKGVLIMALSKDRVAINFSVSNETNEKIMDFAKKNGLTKSSAVNMLVCNQLRGMEASSAMVRAIKNMSDEQLTKILVDSSSDIKNIIEKISD